MSRFTRTALALASFGLSAAALAAPPKPILDNGPVRSEAQEAAVEKVALTWHRNIMGGDRALGLSLMERNFIQHDVEEPSGSLEFVNFFAQPGGPPGPDGGPRSAANAALKAQAEEAKAKGLPPPAVPAREPRPMTLQTRLALITDNDISLALFATRGGADPGRFFGSNMYEIKNGRITQEWYSGPTFHLAADAPNTSDYSPWYTPPYRQVEPQLQFLVSMQPATRAQRDANKRLVADFFDAFFTRHDDRAARVLAPELRSHILGSAQGSAFAQYARDNQVLATSPDTRQVLFLLGQGDLVAIGFPVTLLGDPGAWYATNLLRVRDGKIVEWWYSGYPTGTPALRYGASWPVGKGTRPGTTD